MSNNLPINYHAVKSIVNNASENVFSKRFERLGRAVIHHAPVIGGVAGGLAGITGVGMVLTSSAQTFTGAAVADSGAAIAAGGILILGTVGIGVGIGYLVQGLME